MKIAAIICEFNPLHSGHKRLIDYAKSIAEHVVCIMSGNFTQRGLPACADKYSRAKHAVMSGADMVIELPTVFATASAQNFARGGVAIAHKIGADYLVFGSECGFWTNRTCNSKSNGRCRWASVTPRPLPQLRAVPLSTSPTTLLPWSTCVPLPRLTTR